MRLQDQTQAQNQALEGDGSSEAAATDGIEVLQKFVERSHSTPYSLIMRP
ncbi:MAG: hypothetical protein N4J56_007342 [Chroococcidiopsis sp. SAG 2025]|nr:hypothetical protein [Chroococcidiopsis sp. SAG 2025]